MANKTDFLHIRISPEIKELAEKKASKLGMPLSEYVRYLVLEDVKRK
jgi:antitoxin component of RelBE/YafQ-DinJ toxin-antitoxin module